MPLDKGGMDRYNSIAFRSGCSAAGSALGSGPRGRGFKSRHSDQKSRMCRRSGFFFSRLSLTALRLSFPGGRERSRTDAFGANHAAAVFPGGGCFPLADPRFMASVSAGAFSLWSCIFLLYPFKVLIHFMNNIHPSLFCAKNSPHFCKCCNHFRIIENWRAFHLSEISLCA